jgi:hypothetical protein
MPGLREVAGGRGDRQDDNDPSVGHLGPPDNSISDDS